MPKIRLATVLPGAVGFSEGNINHTYRGQILLEDGVVRIAILKDLEIKELANELLALVLAQSLGLPVPDGYLALVRGSDLDVKKGPSLGDGSRLVFASADVKVPNVTFQLISAAFEGQKILYQGLASWGQLGNLYAFDTWTANIDRHPGNILFGGESEIWVIDHGWCYTGPNWQVIDLIAEGQYTNRLSDWLTVHLTDDQKTQSVKQAAIFNEGIAKIDLSAATRNSYLEALVSPADAAGLKSFLAIRIQSVIVHTNRALGVPSLL